ncbi:unnamed protein product, partial [Polarella glacialis]
KRDRSKDKGKKSKKSRKKKSSSSSSSSSTSSSASGTKPQPAVLDSGISQVLKAMLLKRAEQAALDATIDPLDRQRDDAIGLRDARKTVVPELHKEEESAAAKAEREEHEREAAEILKLHRDMRRRAEG